jgi:hypothetical protein
MRVTSRVSTGGTSGPVWTRTVVALASGWLPVVLDLGFKAWTSGGRRRVSKQVRVLIFRMAAENPTWGAPRIHGELLKLGFPCRKLLSRDGFGEFRELQIPPNAG